MHPNLIFLPGVSTAQIFLGEMGFFLNHAGLFFPNFCRIQPKGSAQFWFLPWGIWIFWGWALSELTWQQGHRWGSWHCHLCSSLCLVSQTAAQHCQGNVVNFLPGCWSGQCVQRAWRGADPPLHCPLAWLGLLDPSAGSGGQLSIPGMWGAAKGRRLQQRKHYWPKAPILLTT